AVREVLMTRYWSLWSWKQAYFLTGANQVMVFTPNYVYVLAVLLFVWLLLWLRLVKERGVTQLLTGLPFQLLLLNAAAVALLPFQINFPGYGLPFSFIIERLSLGAALTLCAMLATLPMKPPEKVTLVLLTVAFFTMVFVDTWKFNRSE